MKKLLTILLVVVSLFGNTQDKIGWFELYKADYFVNSSSGDDNNSGLYPWDAWKTLSKADSEATAGDRIGLSGTFSESLTVSSSGTSGSPITYKGVGSGATISGFATMNGFTHSGGNIWVSDDTIPTNNTRVNMVVIGGVNTPMGRTPNTGYYYYQSTNGTNTITSSDLTGTPDWTGAELVFNRRDFETYRAEITNQSTSTLTFAKYESYTIPYTDLKFIIQNDLGTLDQQNEWYFNPSTKKISIYSTTEPTNVKVSTITDLINVGSYDYITIKNIKVSGANEKGISASASNDLTIDNCEFEFIGLDAVYGGGFASGRDNLTVTNSTFSHCNNGAIGVTEYFEDATIKNNTIDSVGMVYGGGAFYRSGTNNSGTFYGISAQGSGTLFENNTIRNVGYVGIRFRGDSVNVRYNYVEDYCQLNDDGGGIYTYNFSATPYTGSNVHNNIVIKDSDVIDANGNTDTNAAIYLDDNSNGIDVYSNTLVDVLGIGTTLKGFNNNYYANTVYNSKYCLKMRHIGTERAIGSIVIDDNIFVVRESTQQVYYMFTSDSLNIIDSVDFDNNIIDRLGSDKDSIVRKDGDYITLGDWQTTYSQDANSIGMYVPTPPVYVDDLLLKYNKTNYNALLDVSESYYDVSGNVYNNDSVLSPFTSVLLQDTIYRESTLGDSLLVYWNLDQNSNTQDDQVGSNDLINSSNPADYYITGQVNKAIQINGSNQSFYVAYNASYMPTNSTFTYACWFKTVDEGRIFNYYNGTDDDIYVRTTSTGTLNFRVWDTTDANKSAATTNTYTDGVWRHLVVTCEPGEDLVIYVNGVDVTTSTATFTGSQRIGTGGSFVLGNNKPTTGAAAADYMAIDEFRAWNRVLTQSEILELYDSEK